MRVQTYRNKLNRLSKKLIHSVKWLPYTKRFDMWKESRKLILRHKTKLEKDTFDMLLHVSKDIHAKLEAIGITDEKSTAAVTDRYTYHLKTRELVSRFQRIQNSHVCDSQHPFMLFASNVELKFKLIDISRGFPELNCTQLDIDMGQRFTYQLQSLFPTAFERQVIASVWEREDTGQNADRQLLERFKRSSELGLTRLEILQEMALYAEQQRRNSILGALNYDEAA